MLEVVVVGGGMAGVSIAAELSATASVTLVEQERQLAHHTTGRSAATYLQSYGNAVVRALTTASRPDFDRIAATLADAPLLRPRPLLWIADAVAQPALRALLDERVGERALAEMDAADAVARWPVLRPEVVVGAAIDLSASDIDVLALHQAYVRLLQRNGGAIVREARVTSARRHGGRWHVATTAGDRHADVVVNAAGAWADEVAGSAGAAPIGLRPLRRTLFTSPVGTGLSMEGWPMVVDAGDRWYCKPEHDHVLISPADETPSPPCDARPDELDVARALEAVNAATTLDLRSVRSAWAGLRSFVADRSPVVGSRRGEEGFFWFAGQGGYGIQLAPALARTGAALVVGDPVPDDVVALGVTAADLSPERLRPAARAEARR